MSLLLIAGGVSRGVSSSDAVSFDIPDIVFTDGQGDASYDLAQHFSSLIPVGHVVTNIELTSGTLPSGVTLNVANQSIDFVDADGGTAFVSGLVIDVTTAVATVEVATFTVEDSGSGANRPITIGVPFSEGVYASGQGFIVTDNADNPISTQWDELATWRTDDSVLHGALTFLADAGGTYKIKTGTPVALSAVTKANISSTSFDAVVSVVIAGVTYSLSAKHLLNGTVTPRKNYTHLSGSLMSSFCVGGPLRVNGTGSAHASLQAHFEVRGYKVGGSVNRVWVSCTLENTGADNTLANQAASSVTVSIGGSTVHSESSFTIYADCRYTHRGWWGGDPGFYFSLDRAYVSGTGLVPAYDSTVTIPSATLDSYPSSASWNQAGIAKATPDAGWQSDLAPMPRYNAAYMMTGDQRAYNAMRAVHDAFQWTVGQFTGESLFRPRSETTGHPVDLATDGRSSKVRGYTGSNAFNASRQSAPAETTDLSHYPNMGYLPYLLTAEYNELESCLFSGICAWINEAPGGYLGTIDAREWGVTGQVRSNAWGLREIVCAGVAVPDAHPLGTTMRSAVTQAVSKFAERITSINSADSANTGLIITGQSVIYGGTPNDIPDQDATGIVGISPWQDDWLTMSLAYAYGRGWKAELDASGLMDFKAQAVLGRMGTTTDWNWAFWPYAIGLKNAPSDTNYFTTWTQIFNENIASHPDYPGRISSGGYAYSAGKSSISQKTTQQANSSQGVSLRWALSALADAGVTGAADAYALLFNTATVYTDFETYPESALVKK